MLLGLGLPGHGLYPACSVASQMKAVFVLALATLAAGSGGYGSGYGGGSSGIGGGRYGGGVTYGSNNYYVPVDVTFNSEYHFSWKHDGGQAYDFEGAQYYCKSLGYGWRGISFETLEEDAAADNVLYRYGIDIWTSGYKQGYNWVWATGQTLNVQDWSKSGGDYKPQPDNREGNENCLAVLNNVYKDGIKWHDVACYHKKPIICERTISGRAGGITSGGSGYGSGGVTRVLGGSGSGYGTGGVTHIVGSSGYGGRGGSVGSGYGGGRGTISVSRGSGYGH